MCDALRELMKDEIDAEVKKQVQEKINAEVESAEATEKRINALIIALSKADRMEDIIKAAKDHDYQQNLFKEFGLELILTMKFPDIRESTMSGNF